MVNTLHSIFEQVIAPNIQLRVIVADNDVSPSARAYVAENIVNSPWPVIYLHAPARNISIARNACLEQADADWIAFIDDDEIAPPDWITGLLAQVRQYKVDGVFAPTRAVYPEGAPKWMVWGDVHSNHTGGTLSATAHTANALLRFKGTRWEKLRFALSKGKSGGEDTAYFAQVEKLGGRLVSVSGPSVSEPVSNVRLSVRWLLKRRFRMGQTHYDVFLRNTSPATAMIAGAKATICLGAAFLCLPSQRLRMTWLLRGCLHAGVVAAMFNRMRPVLYGGGRA